jgi:hypothetical protein
MKLLIAFDESQSARFAIEDLVNAGLTNDVDATVMCVASPMHDDAMEAEVAVSPSAVAYLAADAATITDLERALDIARVAERRLQKFFPRWALGAVAKIADNQV